MPCAAAPAGWSSLLLQVQFAITKITGIGKRFSNLICKKAEVDPNKR